MRCAETAQGCGTVGISRNLTGWTTAGGGTTTAGETPWQITQSVSAPDIADSVKSLSSVQPSGHKIGSTDVRPRTVDASAKVSNPRMCDQYNVQFQLRHSASPRPAIGKNTTIDLLCEQTIELVGKLAGSESDVVVHDMRQTESVRRAHGYGVRSVPAVVIEEGSLVVAPGAAQTSGFCAMRSFEAACYIRAGTGMSGTFVSMNGR